VEGHDCDIQNHKGFSAKWRLKAVDLLMCRHVVCYGWLGG
jgi:hypothetical protein